jgi:hypothetical protein
MEAPTLATNGWARAMGCAIIKSTGFVSSGPMFYLQTVWESSNLKDGVRRHYKKLCHFVHFLIFIGFFAKPTEETLKVNFYRLPRPMEVKGSGFTQVADKN